VNTYVNSQSAPEEVIRAAQSDTPLPRECLPHPAAGQALERRCRAKAQLVSERARESRCDLATYAHCSAPSLTVSFRHRYRSPSTPRAGSTLPLSHAQGSVHFSTAATPIPAGGRQGLARKGSGPMGSAPGGGISWIDDPKRTGTTHSDVPVSPGSKRPTMERPPGASYSSLAVGHGWTADQSTPSVTVTSPGGTSLTARVVPTVSGTVSAAAAAVARGGAPVSILRGGSKWTQQHREAQGAAAGSASSAAAAGSTASGSGPGLRRVSSGVAADSGAGSGLGSGRGSGAPSGALSMLSAGGGPAGSGVAGRGGVGGAGAVPAGPGFPQAGHALSGSSAGLGRPGSGLGPVPAGSSSLASGGTRQGQGLPLPRGGLSGAGKERESDGTEYSNEEDRQVAEEKAGHAGRGGAAAAASAGRGGASVASWGSADPPAGLAGSRLASGALLSQPGQNGIGAGYGVAPRGSLGAGGGPGARGVSAGSQRPPSPSAGGGAASAASGSGGGSMLFAASLPSAGPARPSSGSGGGSYYAGAAPTGASATAGSAGGYYYGGAGVGAAGGPTRGGGGGGAGGGGARGRPQLSVPGAAVPAEAAPAGHLPPLTAAAAAVCPGGQAAALSPAACSST
jgi:hypothetical protein